MPHQVTYYQHRHPEQTFDPDSHKFLVEWRGQFLFPMKDSDRWSVFDATKLEENFNRVNAAQVPSAIRRKVGSRIGGAVRSERS